MSKIFSRFRKDQSGATAIEYGLIAALVAVALITGASALGGKLDSTFSNIAGKLTVDGGTTGGDTTGDTVQ